MSMSTKTAKRQWSSLSGSEQDNIRSIAVAAYREAGSLRGASDIMRDRGDEFYSFALVKTSVAQALKTEAAARESQASNAIDTAKSRGAPADTKPLLDTEDLKAKLQVIMDELLRQQAEKSLGGKAEVVVQSETPVKIHIPGRQNVVTASREYERVAFLSDLHHPFQDNAALKVVFQSLRDYRPELIVIAGDGFDCFSISDHDREPGRADFLQDEFDAAQPTWKEIDDFGCDVAFIKGNHEERIDRIQRRTPGLFKLRALDLATAAELPKRWMVYEDQTRIRLGNLTILHGNLKGRGTASMHAAAGMLKKLRTSCIFGHLHRFQCFMETSDDGPIRAGFANGHLSNVDEAKYITNPDWQQGFSTIDYDHSAGVFAVTPHLIVKQKMRWGSKTYTAGARED